MGTDKNTVIGFVLIGVLMMGMFYFNNKSRVAYETDQKRIADSIAAVKAKADSIAATKVKVDTQATVLPLPNNTLDVQQSSLSAALAPENFILENKVMKVTFSNVGAQPAKVELKNYKSIHGNNVVILQGSNNKITYPVNVAVNKTTESEKIIFRTSPIITNKDGSKTIRFTAEDSSGRHLKHTYTLPSSDYLMNLDISISGADQLFSGSKLNLLWQTEAPQIEKDHLYERTQTHICYKEGEKNDFEYLGKGDSKSFENEVDWLSVKQQFFASVLIAKNKFRNVKTEWIVPPDSVSSIARTTTTAIVPLGSNKDANIPLQLYYGPSDYKILKQYNNGLEKIVPYGSGVFAFVKYINRFILLPVFDFIQQHVASLGIAVLLLTLFIRLLTSPILYKSYLSGAKMKALKPEVDALKTRFTDKSGQLDQQAFSMEQMKLWRSAGVSPLGGCLPALLQIPIFMSLYYFFQGNIDLRAKSFLWSTDLAAYDSIAKLPFSIPFYGDHVSLFTLTAVLTSLLISVYSMSQMQDNTNPMMKYMPYIFPVLLLGVFNNLPSALTWYYTVSNTITLILQFVIQKYIINHDKILAQINENMKKPVKKSKLQEKMEAMQEAQKKMQENRNKSGR